MDVSVAVTWFFEDEVTKRTKAILDGFLEEAGLAPCLWHVEVSNAMVMAVRRKRLSPIEATRNIERLASIPIVLQPPPGSRQLIEVAALATTHGLTTYDALYLDLALREGAMLATDDDDLKKAARKCGVALC